MAWIPAVIGVISTVMDVQGQRKAGEIEQHRAGVEAARLEEIAGEERATSQRAAQEEVRRGQLEQSRALAVAASSGAGVSDPDVVGHLAQLSAETNYRRMVQLYEGESEAEQLELQAEATRAGGAQARQAAATRATGTAISRGASLYGKYG
jgi:hypothetical protein